MPDLMKLDLFKKGWEKYILQLLLLSALIGITPVKFGSEEILATYQGIKYWNLLCSSLAYWSKIKHGNKDNYMEELSTVQFLG